MEGTKENSNIAKTKKRKNSKITWSSLSLSWEPEVVPRQQDWKTLRPLDRPFLKLPEEDDEEEELPKDEEVALLPLEPMTPTTISPLFQWPNAPKNKTQKSKSFLFLVSPHGSDLHRSKTTLASAPDTVYMIEEKKGRNKKEGVEVAFLGGDMEKK